MFAAKPTRRTIRRLEVEQLDNRVLPSLGVSPHNDGILLQYRDTEPTNLTFNGHISGDADDRPTEEVAFLSERWSTSGDADDRPTEEVAFLSERWSTSGDADDRPTEEYGAIIFGGSDTMTTQAL